MATRYKQLTWRQLWDILRDRCRSARRSLPLVYYTLASLCIMTVALVLLTVFFRPSRVEGDSMYPTLQDRDLLLLSCMGYEPQAGDIVAIRREQATPLIKRVIATEGDRVLIDGNTGEVYLNGALLTEPYIGQGTLPIDLPGEVIVPAGQLFVMGDNRGVSHDSRYADIGFVLAEDVVGKAIYRFLPLSEPHKLY